MKAGMVAGLATPHRRRVVEGAVQLTRASVELGLVRSTRTERLLGSLRTDAESEQVSLTQLGEAQRVGYAVFRAARLLPWHPTCLRQAISVKRMLRRRGIASRLKLGISNSAEGEAHAWVTVQGQPVIGHGELERFAVLAGFE
jgi:predicted N-acetyltransferase YhbS